MPSAKKILINKNDFNTMKILNCHGKVLIRIEDKNESRRTKSGIYVVGDTDYNPSDHAQRVGIVEQVPEYLTKSSSEWETDVELKVGDKVWFDFMMGLNCFQFFVDEVEYKLLSYNDIYAAERDGEIIMINGYCLFDILEGAKQESQLIELIDDKKKDIRYGIMKHSAKPIKDYYSKLWSDDVRLDIGDKVIFGMPPILLEDVLHEVFEGGANLRVSQRKYVLGFEKDGMVYPTSGNVLLQPDEDEAVMENGLIIAERSKKRNNKATVIEASDVDTLKKGDRVHFYPNSATYVTYGGIDYCLLKFNGIDYIIN